MKKTNKKKAEKLNEIMTKCAKSLVVVNKFNNKESTVPDQK